MNRIVLGILTTYPNGASCTAPRRPQWRPLAELSRLAAAEGVLTYVFSPAGVDWRGRRVAAFRWTADRGGRGGRWVRGVFPLPDAVYNRVPTRIAEGRDDVRRTLRRLQRLLGDGVFNPHYLNKSGVARILSTHPQVSRCVPDTAPFRDGRTVRGLLRRHGVVYLKSVGGSLGNDMMRLSRTPDGRWTLRYNAGPMHTRVARFAEWGPLLARIHRLTRGRPFVVQQGIRLARAQGRPFDLRVLAQKLPDGRWTFTGGAARVAGPGQITTHVPRGGRRLPMETALELAFGPQAAPALAALTAQTAVQAAEALDDKLRRRFAETSLDIGIDEDGQPWIFEMNAKPLHFDEGHIQRQRNLHLIRYAKAVAAEGRAKYAG